VARFTTVDPIRDGNNWFSYVNNDPANFIDEFGLTASDKKSLGENVVDTAKEITDTAESWGNKLDGESLTKPEATFQQVFGYGMMAVGLAGVFTGTGVTVGLGFMAAGAIVATNGYNGTKAGPVSTFAGVANPVVGNGNTPFAAPLP
jgi:hypothetical protein